jgi:hypothetical protein
MAVKNTIDMVRMNNMIVYTEDGQAVPMKSLWRRGSAIFIFLRHFSCISCRAHVAQVWAHRFTLEQDGARIYFIGNGSFREIAKFKKEMGIENALIFTDPSRRTFEAAGLRRGIAASVGPKAIANGLELLKQGYRQKHWRREAGDLWQLGGILVVNPGALVRYHYVSEATGDFPTAVEVVNDAAATPESAQDQVPSALPDYSVR